MVDIGEKEQLAKDRNDMLQYARDGNVEKVRTLVQKKGLDINWRETVRSPQEGTLSITMARFLLTPCTQLRLESPLYCACTEGRYAVAEMLLQMSANPDLPNLVRASK